jgi:hypothetical protein
METLIIKDHKTIAKELADAIASFNIAKIGDQLSENGEYSTLNEKEEIVYTNKSTFITWLSNIIKDYKSNNKTTGKLSFIFDRCSYCRIGNPVIIFENGKFPVNMKKPWEMEKCGLMLQFENNLISGITFCFYFLKAENPFNHERKCSKIED